MVSDTDHPELLAQSYEFVEASGAMQGFYDTCAQGESIGCKSLVSDKAVVLLARVLNPVWTQVAVRRHEHGLVDPDLIHILEADGAVVIVRLIKLLSGVVSSKTIGVISALGLLVDTEGAHVLVDVEDHRLAFLRGTVSRSAQSREHFGVPELHRLQWVGD